MQEVFEKIKQRIRIVATEACGYTQLTRAVSESELKDIIEQTEEEYKECTLCYAQTPCEYQNKDCRMPDGEINNGWIPCSERLPEVEINPVTNDYVRYNATYKNGDVSDVRCYAYGEASGGKHWMNSGQIMDEYVIAWQPLPEPYNQKFIQECANPVSQEEREELNKKIRSIPVCTYQTNADRIRAMNDEELAGSRIDRIDFYTKSDNPEYIGDFEGIANSIEEANKLEIAWLQSEVEE